MASSETGSVPRWLTTAAAYGWRLLILAATVYVLALAFGRLQVVIVPVVAALFLSTVLGPPAAWLRRHRVPPLAATWLVFLAAVAVVAAVVAGLVPGISNEFHALGGELSKGFKKVEHWLETGPFHLSRHQVDTYVKKLRDELGSNGTKIVHGALSGLSLILEGVAAALLTLVLTFFFVKDGEDIGRWFLSLFDEDRAADLRAVGHDAWSVLGGYVRGTAVNGVVNSLLLTAGLIGLGVPLVAPIAVLTFIGSFLPLVGAIASGLVAALVALVSKGFVAALVVVGLTVVIHNVEGYLVGPLVLGRAVRLHPIVILLSLTVGTIVGGIIGAFLAVPAVAVALAVNEHYRQARRADLARAAPVLLPDGTDVPGRAGPSNLPGRPTGTDLTGPGGGP